MGSGILYFWYPSSMMIKRFGLVKNILMCSVGGLPIENNSATGYLRERPCPKYHLKIDKYRIVL